MLVRGPRKKVVGYHQALRRVRNAKGKATGLDCRRCGNAAQEWALKPGRDTHSQNVAGYELVYSLDVDDYEPRCRSCRLTEAKNK